jgi:superfamily I DNA/RNA helicase
MENILEFSHGTATLNDEQFKVVTSPVSENQRILASAGSGKQQLLLHVLHIWLNIMILIPVVYYLVTFSRAAAQEMIHRVHKLIGPVAMYAGTFHALSAQILRDRHLSSYQTSLY